MMGDTTKAWDGVLVRKWLGHRLEAARLDQAAADKRGYEAQDDYDKAGRRGVGLPNPNKRWMHPGSGAFAEHLKGIARSG
jgi:hypothetical protein